MVPSPFAEDEDDHTLSSLDAGVRQQFEAAFATFLYKNPAFTSMSHQNLTRLRSKLARESQRNSAAEAELRSQLKELQENKAKTELELQRELLAVTKAKAAREAELKNMIWKTRVEGMAVDEEIRRVKNGGDKITSEDGDIVSPAVPVSPSESEYASNPMLMMPPEIMASDSFQIELNKARIEYERMNRQIEELTRLIENSPGE